MKAKKLISAVLVVAMLFTIMSISVSAASLTFTDTVTYEITSLAELNAANFGISVKVDESKYVAGEGGSKAYTTEVTSAVVDGVDYFVDPDAFFEIFAQNVGEGAKSKTIDITFSITFEDDSVFGELDYEVIIKGFSLPSTSGGDDLIGGALENLKVATDLKIPGTFADFPAIIASSIVTISKPEKTDFYDTEKYSLEGTVIEFQLSTGVTTSLEYNESTKNMFSTVPSTSGNLSVDDTEVAVFFNNTLIFYSPIAVQHKWSDGYVNITTGKYTATKPGYHAIVCEGCGEPHDAQPHTVDESAWTYNNDQTFVANGTESTKCLDCGTVLTRDTFHTADYNTAFGDLHFLLVIFDYINVLLRFIGAAIG